MAELEFQCRQPGTVAFNTMLSRGKGWDGGASGCETPLWGMGRLCGTQVGLNQVLTGE